VVTSGIPQRRLAPLRSLAEHLVCCSVLSSELCCWSRVSQQELHMFDISARKLRAQADIRF
jgi:hypothetical protein